ncbi:hypothetical protein [Pseudomonas aeruginosa]|uniref:hypothetical protein n=1 Tax=Pseudomonas aeruginosa TaxID=287 RepID=UPI00053ED57D|nr:hypothetical protein [Pseudomonas aeruginosa]MBX5936356.1 hypothetical protein [Pseudomonas aeruginosa]MCV3866910.1 hypothetical protein [Pseudomonas aeruginosa]MCV3929559.1 hypothetical protein [Pseudomonas aeruginosa]MEC6557817.1 hypothetical protein [Pseudomonas aeruginosa]HCH0551104.1 hypothetical protein [Pseudomonas aeruginosa]
MSKRKMPPATTFPDEPIVVSLIRQLGWPHSILLLLLNPAVTGRASRMKAAILTLVIYKLQLGPVHD